MNDLISINGVPYRKVVPDEIRDELRVYKDTVKRLRDAFEEQLQDAEQGYKEFIEDGLKFNTIEAEGNLRGWITAKNLLDFYLKEVNEQDN